MVANTIHRARSQYPQGDLERDAQDDDSEDQQKVSVAPESDKVVYSTV